MNRALIYPACLLALIPLLLDGAPALAEPYLAVEEGYKCSVCHVNATGGGLRNQFGIAYAKILVPAHGLDDAITAWTGSLIDSVRIGGDLRAQWSSSAVPNSATVRQFELEQMRLYADVGIIPDRLDVYIDEQVAPNAAQNLEAYARFRSRAGWYLKGGQFYLPFGWRLQDQTAFVREVSGISMAMPQQGVELGLEQSAWSAQLDFTNLPGAATAASGHQATGQSVYVQSSWRLGAAFSLTRSDAGNRHVLGVFAGIRTGPVAWLGEADLVRDASLPRGRSLAAGLVEADWRVLRGHNLKITAEIRDPNRAVSEDQQVRYSVLYEYTPLPFLQLRAGYRRYRGIPQSNFQNRRSSFIELHGYF